MTFHTRTSLPAPTGLLAVSPTGDVAVGLGDRAAALELVGTTLRAAGIGADDRVVVALNSDGEPTGALVAQAAADLGATAATVGPRGRMRLLRTLRALRATTLVATPTGALDFLSRLHLEFLVDPLDLGLRRLLLTGEIAAPRSRDHLAAEFDAPVVEVHTDPVFGLPLALAASGGLEEAQPGLLGLAPPAADAPLSPPFPRGYAELTISPGWHPTLRDTVIRTGLVAALAEDAKGIPLPAHTIGDHLLVRGRWLSIPELTAVLRTIDGIAHWELIVTRPGTLDTATLNVTFARESLTRNPMWKGRIEQALAAGDRR